MLWSGIKLKRLDVFLKIVMIQVALILLEEDRIVVS